MAVCTTPDDILSAPCLVAHATGTDLSSSSPMSHAQCTTSALLKKCSAPSRSLRSCCRRGQRQVQNRPAPCSTPVPGAHCAAGLLARGLQCALATQWLPCMAWCGAPSQLHSTSQADSSSALAQGQRAQQEWHLAPSCSLLPPVWRTWQRRTRRLRWCKLAYRPACHTCCRARCAAASAGVAVAESNASHTVIWNWPASVMHHAHLQPKACISELLCLSTCCCLKRTAGVTLVCAGASAGWAN